MRIKILSSVIVLAAMIYSCSKEYSIEGRDNTVINPPLGQNCKVNNIIAADSLTGAGNYSLFTDFDLAGLATRIVAYDSVRQSGCETPNGYFGNANATTSSAVVPLKKPPPPAATTTNCLRLFLPR